MSLNKSGTSLLAQMVKRLSTMRETWLQSLDCEDPLEKEMAIHSSAIAWKIPWTEEPGSHGVAELDTTERLHFTSYEYGCVAFTCRTEVGLMYGYWSQYVSTCPTSLESLLVFIPKYGYAI